MRQTHLSLYYQLDCVCVCVCVCVLGNIMPVSAVKLLFGLFMHALWCLFLNSLSQHSTFKKTFWDVLAYIYIYFFSSSHYTVLNLIHIILILILLPSTPISSLSKIYSIWVNFLCRVPNHTNHLKFSGLFDTSCYHPVSQLLTIIDKGGGGPDHLKYCLLKAVAH